MAINFPNTPITGQIWTDPSNLIQYLWDGDKWTSAGSTVMLSKKEIPIACSLRGADITAGPAKVGFYMPYSLIVTDVIVGIETPTGGARLIVDINENGNSIFSTRPSVDIGEQTSLSSTLPFVLLLPEYTLVKANLITIDFDQVGSTTPGKDVTVWIIGTEINLGGG